MYLLILITLFFSTGIFAESEDIEQNDVDVIEQRAEDESTVEGLEFSILAHKPNYILPLYYNDKIQGYDLYQGESNDSTPQRNEIKYQISIKLPLFDHIADLPISGYVAYTQVSFWQAYDTKGSAPFRETNYEPEAFLVWDTDKKLAAGWEFKSASFGFTHQSNGRSEPSSRSWNRLNGNLVFSRQNLVVNVNPWYRFSESSDDDDNPDLLDYFGHGQVMLAYKQDDHVYSLVSRNNLESGFSKGSLKASWSFPLYGRIKGYIQVFSGYGNSLIEYNEYTNTVGLGIAVTDFL
ncbi:phospholipase A [Psychromonas aquatilis]|uniref:Phospholipase A1 n=1 Tax=Psychromonas aquatilis TaxID=2005072 RepID=A0ABU9GMR7_9GAMM